MVTVAALFVEPHGVYAGLDGVEVWTESSTQQGLFGGPVHADARAYTGPHPVVAHPPCQRWGRYWHGGPSARERRVCGDDGGCFESALASVRRWGGVLEHPEASHAWAAFGIARPPRAGGWVAADEVGGWTCCVEQGHYGHPARKATWLYAVHTRTPELRWGPSEASKRLDAGCQTAEVRERKRAAGTLITGGRLTTDERLGTPPAFRDVLLEIAMTSTISLARNVDVGHT